MSGACACIYSGDGDGPDAPEVLTWPTSRGGVRCIECKDLVPRGQSYERTFCLYDGRPYVCRTCLACSEIRNLLFCEGWFWGGMWGDIRTFWREGGSPTGCIAKLESSNAKQKLAARFRDYLGVERHGN